MNRIGPPCGVVVRLSCAPRFDESLTIFEDLDFYLRCSGKGLRFVASDSVKYGYFVEGSVRERELKFGRERIKRADEIISDKAKEYGLNWRARIVLRLLRSCLIARYRGSKIGSLGFLALLSLTAPQYLWALIGKRLTVEQSL